MFFLRIERFFTVNSDSSCLKSEPSLIKLTLGDCFVKGGVINVKIQRMDLSFQFQAPNLASIILVHVFLSSRKWY